MAAAAAMLAWGEGISDRYLFVSAYARTARCGVPRGGSSEQRREVRGGRRCSGLRLEWPRVRLRVLGATVRPLFRTRRQGGVLSGACSRSLRRPCVSASDGQETWQSWSCRRGAFWGQDRAGVVSRLDSCSLGVGHVVVLGPAAEGASPWAEVPPHQGPCRRLRSLQ